MEEIDETIKIASILAVSDSVENGMNYFKKRFFKGEDKVETIEKTIDYIRKNKKLPKEKISEILIALGEICNKRKFTNIQKIAGQLTAEEKTHLSRYNISWKDTAGKEVDPRAAMIADKIQIQLDSMKKMFLDIRVYHENYDEYFLIQYDQDQLSQEQISIIDTYINILKKKYLDPEKIKVRKFSGNKTKKNRTLISVTRRDDNGNRSIILGSGDIDIITKNNNVSEYFLALPSMINIAMASSLIDKNATKEDFSLSYGYIQGFIKEQYRAIMGKDLTDHEIRLIEMKRLIILVLPEMYKMSYRKLQESNDMLIKALISA